MNGILLAAFAGIMLAAALASEALSSFDVPRLDGIAVDGSPEDWADRGFRVGILASVEGRVLPAHDLDAEFRLGWDDRGLLVLVIVQDDVALESPSDGELWNGDSVELFVASRVGGEGLYQVVVSPGIDPKHPKLRTWTNRRGASPGLPSPAVEAASAKTDGGYVLEVLLPWSNLPTKPRPGSEIGFQIYVNDSDAPGQRFQAVWYPRTGTDGDPTAMYPIRLASKPSPPVLVTARGTYEQMRRIRIDVTAARDFIGKQARVIRSGRTAAAPQLSEIEGRAGARITLPMPKRGQPTPKLAVAVEGAQKAEIALPDADDARARELLREPIVFKPFVFVGTSFPEADFEHPILAEEIIGPYTIKTTFYDSDYNVVTSAEKPGRYGAVVEIIPEEGRPIKRFLTLFRAPGPAGELDWFIHDVRASVSVPNSLGISPGALARHSRALSAMVKRRLFDGLYRDPTTASLFAGAYESEPEGPPLSPAEDALAADRQWWVGLKRKLYGTEREFPQPLVCPKPIDGPPAPVLREGTAEEAGMKPDAAEKIDAVCRAWAADSDQGFAVCVARNGVVFLHKAYGQRDGRPMQVTDKSWMASITKLLSATLMMMLVDQGLADLDDPVDKFLPPFRGIKVKTPLTIRHLYTHTNGLWDHWGDDLHDFEELIASYYPYLKVGQQHSYNGAGYALAGKIIEAVTGEAIPLFYKRHLLDPLGCAHTDVADTSGGAYSVPMDIAKVGQMLLNRGAYGNMRFFSEATFRKMLPERLTKVLGPDAQIEWGIGCTWFTGEGLGEGTFGHGAASSATLRIDPTNNLVVVMTRNIAGTNFDKYHRQFMSTIAEGLPEKTAR
ncbi:MAG: serine hydrolase [Armatimonadota bacterium]